MKHRQTSLVLLLALLVIGGAFYLRQGTFLEEAGPEVDEAASVPEEKAFLDYRPDEATEEVAGPTGPVIPKPDSHALSGEYTVSFPDSGSMEAFIEEAEARGLRILGSIPELGVIRVQGAGSALSPLLKEGMEVGLNYRMDAPALPDPDLWEELNLAAFNGGVLDFLGVPASEERLSWGTGMTIAILDTGWIDHAAFGDKTVRELDLVEGPREGEYSAHGTAVAGLIGSTNPFAPGVAPGSDLLAVRVLDGEGSGNSFTLASGIIAAVDNGADIINMSLGGHGNSQVLEEAVAYASERGVLLVAASGNDGAARLTYPAAYEEVVGVTAVDAGGNRAPFSNFGAGVDVAAPGYQIHALWENDDFVYFDGTSASSPLVAGMASRILESGHAGTPEDVRHFIRDTANETGPPGYDSQYGEGILNAERIEASGESGIYDMALADIYPAIEESEGGTFPLYVTLENRGTEYIAESTVEISVNGTPYHYRFSGLNEGAVESIQIPMSEISLENGDPYRISARVVLPDTVDDTRPGNDSGNITLQKVPED
ncbi:MAG: S8 family serine peptidase [Oceanipulchritudo sp.]